VPEALQFVGALEAGAPFDPQPRQSSKQPSALM
jgi:hypothetical protein